MTQPPRVLIAAGGTGGHVIPALTIAQALTEVNIDVHWVGTASGLESYLVPKTNYPFHNLTSQSLRGKKGLRYLSALSKGTQGIWQARKLLKDLKPQLVLAMGGYVSAPVAIAAFSKGQRVVIHEQNAIPGLANRLLYRFSHQVFQSFPNTFQAKKKIYTTGNPIRPELLTIDPPDQRLAHRKGPLRLFVIGGSQGALFLNQTVPKAIEKLPPDQRPFIFHQSGHDHVELTQDNYQKSQISAQIVPYTDNVAESYQWADLVIARAGASTVSEIAAVGIASILVPYPYSIDQHQVANAQMLVQNQAAKMVLQKDLTPETLAHLIQYFQQNRHLLVTMATTARALAKVDATKTIVNHCLNHIRN